MSGRLKKWYIIKIYIASQNCSSWKTNFWCIIDTNSFLLQFYHQFGINVFLVLSAENGVNYMIIHMSKLNKGFGNKVRLLTNIILI